MGERGELGECPFCGEGPIGGRMRVEWVMESLDAPVQYRVECDLCDFGGPRFATPEAARDTWQSAVGRKLASWDDLLAALKPFAHLARVMEEGQVLNFRGVYVTWEQAQEAQAAVAKARGEA
jgi:hypothetical protein